MWNRLKKLLGFPYSSEYEAGYNRETMMKMHKPLLIAVVATMFFITWLIGICVFAPDTIAPPEYIDGITSIHFVFMVFTLITLLITVSMRRQLFQYPKFHVILCNIYAVGVCIWSSVLSAYAHYSSAIYVAFIVVVLCVSMVSLFKPWLALIVFFSNYILYLLLSNIFNSYLDREGISQLYSAALAALLGMIISIAFYRFRIRTYYDKQIISQQMHKINQINNQLQKMIHLDNLTGIFNRRFYEEVLPIELDNINKENPVCSIMLDIDYFKLFNDQYGHPAGDDCLRTVARIVDETVPEKVGFAVRYGGEEFFILSEISSIKDARLLGETICRNVERAYIIHSKSPFGKVTVSCGVFYIDENEKYSLDEMTKKSDEALYESKQNGRNKVTLYTS